VASFAEVFESSSGLMILCALLSAAVWYFARYLDLYASEDSVDYDDLELKELHRKRDPKITSREATPAPRRRKFVPMASQGGGDVMVTRDNDQAEAPEELRFNMMDLSDHLEDSMEAPSRNRPQNLVY
jgi:hypothetical protein